MVFAGPLPDLEEQIRRLEPIDPTLAQLLNPSYDLTDAGQELIDNERFLTKGCALTVGLVEIMQTDTLTLVDLAIEISFRREVKGEEIPETWTGRVTGEARKNPKDKFNMTIGVLSAYQNALGTIAHRIEKRVNGELKHADDMKQDGKRRRAAKEKKRGGHGASKAAKVDKKTKKVAKKK